MAKYERLIKENVAPQGAVSIGIKNSSGTIIGQFPLGTLAHTYGTKRFSIGLLSDVHFSQGDRPAYSNAGVKLNKALEFFRTYGVAAVGIAGDITYERRLWEYQQFKLSYDLYARYFPIYTCMGNHDVYYNKSGEGYVSSLADWNTYTGQDGYNATHLIATHNGKKYYITTLSCSRWQPNTGELYYSDTDIAWLETQLSQQANDITFVFVHIPFADRAGDAGYAYWPASVLRGSNLVSLRNLANSYPNAIWICGHTHDAWEYQGINYTTDDAGDRADLVNSNIISSAQLSAGKGNNPDANIWPCNGAARNSAWHLHLPSSNNADFYGSTSKTEGQFAVLDIYDDCIIVKGCAFDNTVSGTTIPAPVRFLPIAQYKLTI